VALGYIRFNPSDTCELPRVEKKEIRPLDDKAIGDFLRVIRGHRFEDVYLVTLFTGMRQGEVCGLTWDSVSFDSGTILINKQLQKIPGQRGAYHLVPTKNSKWRTITPAGSVMETLRRRKAQQAQQRLQAGELWEDSGFVFTNELGHHLSPHTVYHQFKTLAAAIGLPEARFHDLRHSYAVAAMRNGDPVKTVQENLGHHSAAFTLDIYGHVTDTMKKESADRMEQYIHAVSSL
jgi:integrase